jgi:hypothetical protein
MVRMWEVMVFFTVCTTHRQDAEERLSDTLFHVEHPQRV